MPPALRAIFALLQLLVAFPAGRVVARLSQDTAATTALFVNNTAATTAGMAVVSAAGAAEKVKAYTAALRATVAAVW